MIEEDYNYGYVIALNDVELTVWDGNMSKVLFKKGDKLIVSYFEVDGSLGLTVNNIEFCCGNKQRVNFEEHFNIDVQ